MIRRVRRVRGAVLIIWIAIGLLMLSVPASAVAVTARPEVFAFTARALVKTQDHQLTAFPVSSTASAAREQARARRSASASNSASSTTLWELVAAATAHATRSCLAAVFTVARSIDQT